MGISPAQLVTILSASIAPVIMISGVGLLLLSMTNRYSRVIDRARDLVKRLDAGESTHAALMLEELRITYRRGRILRLAILLSSFSILFVAVTVFSLFAEQVLGVGADYFSVPASAWHCWRCSHRYISSYAISACRWQGWNSRSAPTSSFPTASKRVNPSTSAGLGIVAPKQK